MNGWMTDTIGIVLRTTLLLSLTACFVHVALRLLRIRSPHWHRVAWALVLAQGLIVVPLSLDIPWYEAAARDTTIGPTSPSVFRGLSGGLNWSADSPPLEAEVEVAAHAAAAMDSLPAPAPDLATGWVALVGLAGAVWIAGMIGVAGVTAGSYLLFLLRVGQARPAPQVWRVVWEQLLVQARVSRPIPLQVHPTLGPMLCRLPGGYRVIVPEDYWDELTEDQQAAVLRHELAHYQRGDIWKSLLARLVLIPHWFNPFAWWAARKFEEGSEWACDQTLAESDPRQVPAYARALLAMVEPLENYRIGVSSAGGARLSVRIRRLLTPSTSEDTRMKRCVLLGLLVCLIGVGVVRLQLVAKEPPENEAAAAQAGDDEQQQPADEVDEEAERQVAELARKLVVGDDPLLKRFQASLATRAGRIVVMDHAAGVADMLRREAEADALPRYVDKRFEKQGEAYRLRADQKAYRTHLLRRFQTFNEDVDRMKPVVQELAKKINDTSDINKLVKRFLTHEIGPMMIYLHHLGGQLRPDQRLIEEKLGEVFVKDDKGRYVIRPGRREEAELQLAKVRKAVRGAKLIHDELTEWSRDLATPDALHKALKKAFGEPAFAALIARDFINDDEEPVQQRVDNFFRELEELTVDNGDGVVLREGEPTTEVQRVMKTYERLRVGAARLKGPLESFAARIYAVDPLHKGWQETMPHVLVQMQLGEEIGGGETDPGRAVRALLGEILQEDDKGGLEVRGEDPEQVAEFVQDMFRQHREIRRRGRTLDRFAGQLDDKPLQEVFQSLAGKLLVVYSIRDELERLQINGIPIWIERHFDKTGKGLVLKDGAEEEIQHVLEAVKEVQQELDKDDF